MSRPDLRIVAGLATLPARLEASPQERRDAQAMLDLVHERFAMIDGTAAPLEATSTPRQIALRTAAKALLLVERYDREGERRTPA